MNLSLFIAKRYLFSKKSQNVINIISGISILGITTGTMALIVVLSVFNGFDNTIRALFNSFDPDFKITVKEGKTFDTKNAEIQNLYKYKGIAYYSDCLEENVLFEYGNKQKVGIVKGVSDQFNKMSGIDTMIIDGKFQLHRGKEPLAIVGHGVAYELAVGLNFITPLKISAIKRDGKVSIDVENAFNKMNIFPGGVFAIQQEYDGQYVIVPLAFARDLLDYTAEVSAIEIRIKDKQNVSRVKKELQQILGDKYTIKDRYQQHEMLFKTMKSENWIIYLILTFILIIASFNGIGSLTMLIIDKKEDILILQKLGAENKLVRKLFMFEGMMIYVIGAISGLALGALLCWIQIKFGIITFPASSTFIIKEYPVKMEFFDFIAVLLIVFSIGFLASWYPIRFITRKYFPVIMN
jgi:lipoprotein-releasing system permease protein